jgi:hypothetical protein
MDTLLDVIGHVVVDVATGCACAGATWLTIAHFSLPGKFLWGLPTLWTFVVIADGLGEHLGNLLR